MNEKICQLSRGQAGSRIGLLIAQWFVKAITVYHVVGSIPLSVCFRIAHHLISTICSFFQLHNIISSIWHAFIECSCSAHKQVITRSGKFHIISKCLSEYGLWIGFYEVLEVFTNFLMKEVDAVIVLLYQAFIYDIY